MPRTRNNHPPTQALQRLLALLEAHCPRLTVEDYLRGMADNERSLARQVSELLELIRLYGSPAVAQALAKAHAGRAFGSDYVANILRQQLSPRPVQPRLRLNHPELDQLVTDPLFAKRRFGMKRFLTLTTLSQ